MPEPIKVLTPAEIQRRHAVLAASPSIAKAAAALGMGTTTLRHFIKRHGAAPQTEAVQFPVFPDDDIPTSELAKIQSIRFTKRLEHRQSKKWMPIKINMRGPIGVSTIGDPHVDDDGCNWPLLEQHGEIHRKTEGLFALNIGDTTNNWLDRYARLWAQQETSQKTARKLAEYLLKDMGFNWLVWLMGNHDMWNEGAEILRRMNGTMVPMEDHQAQFKLVFPNGRECRIWAAHNFPGHSQWNSLHGPQKAAHTKDWAHIYTNGHTHNWAMHQEESASRDFVYWLIRARGYKYIDEYADRLGHAPQNEGAAIMSVIDPDATSESGFVQCFADIAAGADYLKYLRRKRKA